MNGFEDVGVVWNRMMLRFSVLISTIALPSLSLMSPRQEPLTCPRIDKDKRPAGMSLAGELYATFNAEVKPRKVAAGTSAPTHPIGWIE